MATGHGDYASVYRTTKKDVKAQGYGKPGTLVTIHDGIKEDYFEHENGETYVSLKLSNKAARDLLKSLKAAFGESDTSE